MKIIGITGPSGSGKGSCCELLVQIGIPWIDTDRVYHELIEAPSACVEELTATFGQSILNKQGGVDRTVLASIVFSDQTHGKVDLLNQITHKFVRVQTLHLIEEYRTQGKNAVIIDAPLLFEAGFDAMCDFCISVIAAGEIRLERIMARDGITKDRAEARLAAQKTDDYYTSRSKYTIINNSDKEKIRDQIMSILKLEGLIF